MRPLDPESLGSHTARLYRAAYGLCGSRQDAEDLVQDTFERVLKRPRFLRRDEDLVYLLRVLRNTWISSRRAKRQVPTSPAGQGLPAGRAPWPAELYERELARVGADSGHGPERPRRDRRVLVEHQQCR
jgi:DNA-directed RNA polymerase specialized sigma24 family protein